MTNRHDADSEARRAAFEKAHANIWYVVPHFYSCGDDGEYISVHTKLAYQLWNAALDSVAAPLPQQEVVEKVARAIWMEENKRSGHSEIERWCNDVFKHEYAGDGYRDKAKAAIAAMPKLLSEDEFMSIMLSELEVKCGGYCYGGIVSRKSIADAYRAILTAMEGREDATS